MSAPSRAVRASHRLVNAATAALQQRGVRRNAEMRARGADPRMRRQTDSRIADTWTP